MLMRTRSPSAKGVPASIRSAVHSTLFSVFCSSSLAPLPSVESDGRNRHSVTPRIASDSEADLRISAEETEEFIER